jgi:hypothetical protein
MAGGLLVAAAYLAGALWSAHLSPLARRPLLDGLAPSAPYRWVNPPPGLADTNRKPTPGRFALSFGPDGLHGTAYATPDAQVTIIVPDDAIEPAPGERSIELTIEPLDPATLGTPDPPFLAVGNALRIGAAYEPGGEPVTELRKPIQVVLSYPFVVGIASQHTVLVSTDGQRWTKTRTTDQLVASQAYGPMRSPGYVMVGGRRHATGSATDAGGEGLPIAVIGAGVAAIVLGLVIVFGGRRDRGRDRR